MGGWASLKTQNTKITPKLIGKVIIALKEFEEDFNIWLNYHEIGPIQFVCPVGSSSYYLIDPPDTEYGDIDYLVEFPYIQETFKNTRNHENKSLNFYKKQLMEFVKVYNRDYIEVEDTLKSNGNYLILKLFTDEIVQVDLIASLNNYTQWNVERFTPQHNLKGVISGTLFTALNELYKINIGDRGLTLRLKDGELVSGNYRKDVIIKTVSTNYYNFWKDLLIWVNEQSSMSAPIMNPLLQEYPGIEDNMLPSAMLGLKGFVYSLEENNLLDSVFFPESTAQKMLAKIAYKYVHLLDTIIDNPKYYKVDSLETQKKINILKKQINQGKNFANIFMI